MRPSQGVEVNAVVLALGFGEHLPQAAREVYSNVQIVPQTR